MGRGTDPAAALDHLNKIVTRRAVVFFISDFQAPDFSRDLAVTARRHDLIAIRIQDERESVFPPLESSRWRTRRRASKLKSMPPTAMCARHFAQLAQAQLTETMRVLRQNRIDRIELRTGDDYLPALRSFFKQRERRMMVR